MNRYLYIALTIVVIAILWFGGFSINAGGHGLSFKQGHLEIK